MYIQMVSIHGLIRGEKVEMGRDSDTGGQVRYVLDLVRALAACEGVDQVDLFTRQIRDKRVSPDYSRQIEPLAPNARIVRLPCGGGRYFRKEKLWPYLDEFIDRMIAFTRRENRIPAFVHGHYVDAGYVARNVASIFGVPFIFSGHSLGRPKQGYLRERGYSDEQIERDYTIGRRIDEEERCLGEADLVVTSTNYEREVNYGMYRNAQTPRYKVLAPGLDLSILFPYYNYELPGTEVDEVYKQARMRMMKELKRFHFHQDKPLILAVCRPERRKNINMLIECYGRDPNLQALANLAIFAGIRQDIEEMNPDEQEVLSQMLLLMDRYDLYGKMAIPKNHDSETDIPELYRLAASLHGVFVSSAYVENFGLTFIEAAATGLPFIGTDTGGPVDIQNNTQAGVLADLSNPENLTAAMHRVLTEEGLWEKLSSNGINNTRKHYTWGAHCEDYLACLKEVQGRPVKTVHIATEDRVPLGKQFAGIQHLLITDIDDTLLGDEAAFHRLVEELSRHKVDLGFGVATGRWLESARDVLRENSLTDVGIFITSVGSEIYYGPTHVPDKGWQRHISHRWYPDRIHEALAGLSFMELQPEPETQRKFKISYNLDDSVDAQEALPLMHEALTRARAAYNLVYSHGAFIDVLPYRASKGKAIHYLSNKWEIPLSRIVTAGNSGNDADMLLGTVRGVVVNNHEAELEKLRSAHRIYFAEGSYADGILEGLRHYKVLE